MVLVWLMIDIKNISDDKIDAGEKAAIESALAELKAVVKNTDATKEALEAATKKYNIMTP